MRSQQRLTKKMHELAICRSVLRQVMAVAAERNACRVECITLQIGPLSGVEPGLVRQAFPLIAAGTPCEDAILEIQSRSVQVRCRICDTISDVPSNRLLCAQCTTSRVDLISGDELLLVRVELLDG